MYQLRRPKIGMLLLAPTRFHNLGEGTEHGPYRQRKEVEAEALRARFSFAEIIFPGIVYTREDAVRSIRLFEEGQADMVFAHFLSWSDDFAWIRFLRDIKPIPLLHAVITREQPGFSDSLTEDRFVEFLAAGGLVGALEGSGSLARFNRPMVRQIVGGLEEVAEQTEMFARAACLRTELREAVFGLLPSFNEAMWSTYVDPYNLFAQVGPELRFLTVAALEEEIEATSQARTAAAMETILHTYRAQGEINREKMFASVEASIAMENLARKAGVELLVLNDIDPVLMRRIGLRPGFSPCPGTRDLMVVPEGDIGAGIACYILRKLSGRGVNFIEPFYLDKPGNAFAAGHAGPHDYTVAGGHTILSTDTRFVKSGFKHAGAPFAWHRIGPGEKTMVHVSQSGGRFRMVCGLVDSLEGGHFLAGYSHGLFRSRIPGEEFFRQLMEIGVTQHYALADGNWISPLRLAAELLDFAFSQIG